VARRKQPLAIVRSELERYAQRGVFRSFSETASGNGNSEFRFNWLWNLPFQVTFEAQRGALSFKKLLPNVAAESNLNAGLKAFLKDYASAERPPHRRIDADRVALRYSNRRGTVALTFLIASDQYSYGVQRAINLINELFIGFLNLRYPEYMVKNFHLPEE
jgi:hypothetical protein